MSSTTYGVLYDAARVSEIRHALHCSLGASPIPYLSGPTVIRHALHRVADAVVLVTCFDIFSPLKGEK